MKKLFLLHILISALFCFCGKPSDPNKIEPFRKNHELFEKANYNFASGSNYFRMQHFDLNKLTDTIFKCHREIFQDEGMVNLINADVYNWISDSVFIGSSKTMKGSFVLDTTNMLLLENPDSYYSNAEIKQGQPIWHQLFQLKHQMHTAHIDGKNIYYEFVATNGRLIRNMGEYRIETTGDYIPEYMHVGGRATKANLRYSCDEYLVDFFILISSDDFFKGKLAVKISDTISYYHPAEMK